MGEKKPILEKKSRKKFILSLPLLVRIRRPKHYTGMALFNIGIEGQAISVVLSNVSQDIDGATSPGIIFIDH